MTDTASQLASIMDLIANMEHLVSLNNLIAGGVITDMQSIREVAALSSAQLEMNLIGSKMVLDGSEFSKQMYNQLGDLINQD